MSSAFRVSIYTSKNITVDAIRFDGNVDDVREFAGKENVREYPYRVQVFNGAVWVDVYPGWWVGKHDEDIVLFSAGSFKRFFLGE